MLKKMIRKISSGITAGLMCFSVMTAFPSAVVHLSAEETNSADLDLSAPAHEKTLTPNEDGTYDLSLSVKGASKASVEQTNADVIIIFDRSGSMSTSSNPDCAPWDWECKNRTRLSDTKIAVKALGEELLKQKGVKLSLISFSTNAKPEISSTSSKDVFNSKVEQISADGGTNWEEALNAVKNQQTQSGEKKYVVFVSDGKPTFRTSQYSDWAKDWNRSFHCYGSGNDDSNGWNYGAAKNKATDLVNAGYELYTVNAYGEATNMQNLINDAYKNKGVPSEPHYFEARNSDALNRAFDDIVQQINHSATYTNVTIHDPLTAETGVVTDENGNIRDFRYTVTDKDGQVVNQNGGLTLNDGTTLSPAQYDSSKHTVTWNLGDNYKLVDGYTYKVTFEVYPTQDTIDKITDLKNGKTVNRGANITSENKVYTNTTDNRVTYHIVKDNVIGEEKSVNYERPLMDVEPVQIILNKEWNDNLDTSGRPSNITFDVKRDGETVGTITLDTNSWNKTYYLSKGIVKESEEVRTSGHLYTFEEKLNDSDQKKYETSTVTTKPMLVGGTLKEGKGEGYTDFVANNTFEVTNTLKGRLEITKTVETAIGSETAPADSEFTVNVSLKDKDGNVLEAVSYVKKMVEGNGSVVGVTNNEGTATITLKAGEHVLFENLPTGTTYEVTETGIPEGYTNRVISYSNNGKKITANTKDTVNVVNDYFRITAEKVWSDNNNQDGKRVPVEFKLQSSTDGSTFTDVARSERTIGTTEDLATTWNGYPAKDVDGKTLTYRVTESNVPEGYTSSTVGEDGNYTITNSHTPEKVTLSGTKTWNDDNNRDGKRPESITVKLIADGADTAKSVTTDASKDWKYSFTDLPKYKNGNEIAYTVAEETVQGYTTTIDGYNITNSYTPEMVSVSGEKTWADNNNQDGIRPDSIMVRLSADGREVSSKEVRADADGQWTYSFSDLPKYSNGNEIVYTVSEDTVAGYTTTINGYNITNTHTPETTTISGMKSWDDANNQDGKRPTEITVKVLDGDEVVTSKRVTAENDWSYSFENLPKYRNGEEITYTVSEDDVNDYTLTTGNKDNGYNITNTHTPEKVSVSGTKTWDDSNNQDGIRPDSIMVRLSADGREVSSKEVRADADGQWTYSFSDLPKYSNGNEIVYTVSEDTVAGYTTTINGYNITNTHTPETIDISGSKIWSDDNNRDGVRPTSITVNLFANGTKYADKVVTPDASGNWTYTFAGVPKKANGTDITYTVTENGVDNYTTSIDGLTIINTHESAKTSISVTKNWDDANNQDGKRPTTIAVNLLSNGKVVETKEIGSDINGKWTYIFSDLPVYENGKKIAYEVTENNVDGYISNISENGTDGYSITNTHTPETTEVIGTKTWNDADDQDGKRPDSITVRLLADGTEVAHTTATAESNWTYSFTGLAKYAGGHEITYTVSEDEVPDYSTDVSGYDITNSYTPEKTAINVFKVWDDADNQDGLRPENLTIHLLANNTDTGKTLILNAGNKWRGTFTELDKKAAGEDIRYTISEDLPDGYEISTLTNTENTFVITNKHTPVLTSVGGTKTWVDNNNQDGIRPAQVTIRLHASNTDEVRVTQASESSDWNYSFENLPVYSNGQVIQYWVTEDEVDGYTPAQDGTDFTNTHTPEKIEKVSGAKLWDDADNQDGKRPDHIVVSLLADGETAHHYDGTEVAPLEVRADANGNWTYEFTDLPRYKNGKLINYTVCEVTVDGYEAQYSSDGLNITNIHVPEKYEQITGHKEWNDGNDTDGKRPESITVRLLADGTEVAHTTATAESNWTFGFKNLPKYKEGNLISYTVTEDEVEGYTTAVDGNVIDGFKITNTHEPETIEKISGTKIWNDNNNQDSIRPTSITVRLLANGQEMKSVTVNEFSGWHYEFTGLPKYSNGQEINYTIAEDEVEGYTTEVNGYDLINTHTPDRMNITGEKIWDDADNQDGKRPESILVHLYANGEQATDEQGNPYIAAVTAENNWKFSFDNVYRYRDGNPVRYTVVEEYVEGYETGTVTGNAKDGFTITNRHTPEMISRIHGTKVWNDNNNQDGKRPESITVRLLADGNEIAEQNVTADHDWNYEFTNLPKYSDGREIRYTVTEDSVEGYTGDVTQNDEYEFTVTNTHTPETVRINGQKVWNDSNNASGRRPESITVQLLANGVQLAETTANADLDWFFSFGDLPVYENGEKITYTVTETPVEGYRTTISGDAVNGFTVRNTARPETPKTNDDPKIEVPPTKPTTTTVKRRPQTPFTADTTDIAFYGGFAVAGLIVALGIILFRKKED